MDASPEIIQQIILCIFASLLCVFFAAWLALLLYRFLFRWFRTLVKRLHPAQWGAIAAVMCVCTLYSGKNTNGVQNAGMGTMGVQPGAMVVSGGPTLMDGTPIDPLSVTPEDVSNGWRVVEETAAEAFASPPANAVTNEKWRLRGAHDDAFHIATNGWSYPFARGVTVLSRGEIRRDIRLHEFPRAFEQDMSLLPMSRRPLLPEGRWESVFWHGATSSNTLLATWCNAALGRDATNPVSFQVELFPNGGFAYRYEDRAVRHVRVWPFDWDDDGLENSVDPEPETAGPDAHGTNAEWYNTVCSNLLTASAVQGDDHLVELSWREGVNSNAYYFVDVVTDMGPTPIWFIGDRESDLGDPVVVAMGGVTNRVPLLIGVNYAVTSDTPFSVSVPDEYVFVEVETNMPCAVSIHWPLDFTFTEGFSGGDRIYTIGVEPYDPGGVFSWEMRGGATPRSGGCNCVSYSGRTVVFNCLVSCYCGGDCKANGTYNYGGASFAVTGGVCRCGFDDPERYNPPTYDATNEPSISISFSRQAVIFEDAYEDKPGEWQSKRSTRVRLTVDAYGGQNGGTLTLSADNLHKLDPIACGPLQLPSSVALGAEESYFATFLCEGASASVTEGDVSVSGTFVEASTGCHIFSSSSMTVLKVELREYASAPTGVCLNRHTYGVGEWVQLLNYPNLSGGESPWSDDLNAVNGWLLTCPLTNDLPVGLKISAFGTEYRPLFKVMEPNGIRVANEGYEKMVREPTQPGGIVLTFDIYVLPNNVNFDNIRMAEIPWLQGGTVEGYYALPEQAEHRYHGTKQGAGRWHAIVSTNNNFWSQDRAGQIPINTGWIAGSKTWDIPIGWKGALDLGETAVKIIGQSNTFQQNFELESNGSLRIEKHGHWVKRTLGGNPDAPQGHVYLDGSIKE